MKKRFLSILLTLCMILSVLPLTPVVAMATPNATVEKVQTLINALPDADTITTENRVDVENQLTAIDEAKLPLGDEEQDTLDFTKYNDAIAALNELDGMGGSEVPNVMATAGILDVGNKTFEGVTESTTYKFGSGNVTFDPNTSTLTLDNATITINSIENGDVAAIYSKISNLKIVLKGENKITISNTSSDNKVLAMCLEKGATISSSGNNSKLIIESTGKNNVGIYSEAALSILSGTTISIEDKTTAADSKGYMLGIYSKGNLSMNNVKYTATGVLCAIDLKGNYTSTLTNVTFNVNCTPPKNFSLNDPTMMAIGVHMMQLGSGKNTITGCSGSITAQIPLYIDGTTELKNSNLTLTTDNYYAANLNDSLTISGGTLKFKSTGSNSRGFYIKNSSKLVFTDSTNVTVDVGMAGILAEGTSSVEIKSGTVNTIATVGLALNGSGNQFTLTGGKLNMNPKSGVSTPIGIQNKGTVTVSGGNLITTGMYNAITNLGGKTVSFSGGTHTLGVAAGGTGYGDDGLANTLSISNNANVTFTGGQFNISLDGKLNLSGGTLNADGAASNGIIMFNGSVANLTGGTLNVKNTTNGILMNAGGDLKFAGTNATLIGSNAGWATTSTSGKYTVTGGTVVLQGGKYAAGNIYSSSLPEDYCVYAGSSESDASLVASPTIATFSGNTYVLIRATRSFNLTVESVYLNDYGLELPNDSVPATYTHKEGSGISYAAPDAYEDFHFDHWELNKTNVGTAKTYTGTMPSGDATLSAVYVLCSSDKTPPCGQQATCDICGEKFGLVQLHKYDQEVVDDKYEITAPTCEDAGKYYKSCTCGASAEGWGTSDTFTFTVPAAGHTGGTATCTEKAICSTCGHEYGSKKPHDYTEKAETEDACKTRPTCSTVGKYYYSCSVCHRAEFNDRHTFSGTSFDPNNHWLCKYLNGTITSFGSDTDDVTIQLIESGETEPAAEVTVTGNSATYQIHITPQSTYTMKVMKKSHVTREYTVVVGTENVTLDAKIHLIGDITGDGKVNTSDVSKANAHVKKASTLTGYEFACADVSGDGKVNTSDVSKMNAHVKKTSTLW